MRPIYRHGNMPPPIAKVHKLFLSKFITEAGAAIETGEYVQVFECDSPDEVVARCTLHPIFGGATNPDFLLQCLLDRKTSRWYVVGLGLGQRITIGDIDLKTGDVIPGEYEQAPVLYFAKCTENWAKEQGKQKHRRADRLTEHPAGRAGVDLYREILIEAVKKKREQAARQRVQLSAWEEKVQLSLGKEKDACE